MLSVNITSIFLSTPIMNKKRHIKPPKRRFVRREVSTKTTKKTYEVPVEGSLGLLALGYTGYIAWQNKIKESTQ